jgi:hypothetical protein
MHYCQQGAVKPNVYVVTCKKCTRTLGYAANIFRQPGEDHGAIFFSMRFRDLFR